MWQHEILDPLEPDDEPIEFERLSVGANWNDLEIIHEGDGRFYIQAVDDCDGEIEIGMAEDLEVAKAMAERWAIDQIADMLRALGAEGIWMVRGAHLPKLRWWTIADQYKEIELEPGQAHGRIMLVRFPTGDGREGGIEYYG